MQIFGIGPLEFLFIIVIMILVLGPRGMVKAAREAGKAIRKLTRSPLWAEIVGTSREVRNLPAKIIKEAGIEEEVEELRRSTLPAAFPQNGYSHQPEKLPLKIEIAATLKNKTRKPVSKRKPGGTPAAKKNKPGKSGGKKA
jgi:Sec-independent protein translocase protein TatA